MNGENKMKICHVITRMIVGGAQENTLLTIRGHLEKGHEVVLVTGFSPGREGELLKQVQMPEFRIVVMPELVRNLNPVKDFAALVKLRKFLKKEHFDVVHTHTSKAGIIGRIAARMAGTPVVVHTVHGLAFHPYEKPWKNFLYKSLEHLAALFCDRIFTVAQAMIDQCVDAGVAPREKFKVVYSGMDTGAFAAAKREPELRKKLCLPDDAVTIVTVARLFQQKGYEELMPAAKKLLPEFPKLHFLFIGDGPMRPELEKCVAEMGATNRFHFAGLIPPGEVCCYIAQADLLCHLSLHEGLPRAAVQALAEGIPVIGYHLDGTPEVVINDETGYTVPPQDCEAVVDAARKLLSAPELRKQMGAKGKALVIKQFDWHKMSDILEKEYLELLDFQRRR